MARTKCKTAGKLPKGLSYWSSVTWRCKKRERKGPVPLNPIYRYETADAAMQKACISSHQDNSICCMYKSGRKIRCYSNGKIIK